MKPKVREILQHNWNSFALPPNVTVDQLVENVMNGLLSTKNKIFVHAPGVNSSEWHPSIKKQFFKDVSNAGKWKNARPEDDWICLDIDGTTLSGHATRTTLGGTIRSLMYMWYYIQQSGISDTPWDSPHVFTIASGDDVVVWVKPQYATILMESIKRLSTRDTSYQEVGLGQCIK